MFLINKYSSKVTLFAVLPGAGESSGRERELDSSDVKVKTSFRTACFLKEFHLEKERERERAKD